MEANASNQLETSPNLEPKRAKHTVKDVQQLLGGISRSTVMPEILYRFHNHRFLSLTL
jgi:hypothetical protein